MGFDIQVQLSAAAVFIQGLLSFFSPCVLPLLPVYIGYLSGGSARRNEDGTWSYDRKKVFVNTLFFVLGIGFAFLGMGLGFLAAGSVLGRHRVLLARIGGLIVILFGLYQLGVFRRSAVLEQEKRIPLRLDRMTMSPLAALLMGFVFSFAWTPCVGPVLASVMLMTASASSRMQGILYTLLYTLGFVLPFLAVGLFAASLLDLFRKHRNIVKYTGTVGAVLLILMGILMVSGSMNGISTFFANLQPGQETVVPVETGTEKETGLRGEPEAETEKETQEYTEKTPETEKETQTDTDGEDGYLLQFELKDQFGNTHDLSDYRGKVVFLNIWATWCPPCRGEMPDIQNLYEKYKDSEDVAVLGLSFPGYGGEGTVEEIAAFMEENGYTYPTLMDTSAHLSYELGITAFPTTFMIDREGKIFGYVQGAMQEPVMESIIDQTLRGERTAG